MHYNRGWKGSVPTGKSAEPRLTSGAFEMLENLGYGRLPGILLRSGYFRGIANG